MRLMREREMMLEANQKIREAVAARMAATPHDDPKLAGYKPHPLAGCQPAQEAAAAVLADVWRQPEVGCTACEGSPFVAKAVRTMEASQRSTAEAAPADHATLAAELPAEFLEQIKNLDLKPATPTAPAEFKIERIGGTMSPEQLEAAWAGIKARREEMMARIRGDEPIETVEITNGYKPRTGFRLIGLTGPAGCGKNFVAAMIPDARVIALADPLYAGLAEMLGVSEDSLRVRSAKERPIDWLGKSPRQLLQTLGTEWGRKLVADDVWLRIAERRLNELEEDGFRSAVIADVRFDNEAEMIRARGGEVWRIEREPETAAADHVSEAGISPALIDRVIDNRGTPDQTRRLVLEALAG